MKFRHAGRNGAKSRSLISFTFLFKKTQLHIIPDSAGEGIPRVSGGVVMDVSLVYI